jgi:hypothetical protein
MQMFPQSVPSLGCIVKQILPFDSYKIFCEATTNSLAGTCVGFQNPITIPSVCNIKLYPPTLNFAFMCDLTTTNYLNQTTGTLQRTCHILTSPEHLNRPTFKCLMPPDARSMNCLIPPYANISVITQTITSACDPAGISQENVAIISSCIVIFNVLFVAGLIYFVVYRTEQIKSIFFKSDPNSGPEAV